MNKHGNGQAAVRIEGKLYVVNVTSYNDLTIKINRILTSLGLPKLDDDYTREGDIIIA